YGVSMPRGLSAVGDWNPAVRLSPKHTIWLHGLILWDGFYRPRRGVYNAFLYNGGREEEFLATSFVIGWSRAAIFLTIPHLQGTTNHHGRAADRERRMANFAHKRAGRSGVGIRQASPHALG